LNYLPFCGGWFYGAASGEERAAYYCSYGLLLDAPAGVPTVDGIMFLLRRRRRQ
jgi:hypothetical protein